MSPRAVKAPKPPTMPLLLGAAAADVVLILVFAAVGRDAHQRGDILTGVLLTAWPFLAGAALGWLVGRAWRDPLSVRRAGTAMPSAARRSECRRAGVRRVPRRQTP